MSSAGRTALVTGGARGIGYAIASELAADGCSIVISDIMADAASEAAEKLAGGGIETLATSGDVSKSADVERMFAAAVGKFGAVDILVNNAGITRDGLLLRLDEKDWDLVLSVNLKGAFLCTKAAARIMMKNRWGRIINISSVVGVMGNPGQANYSASKAGLIGLTKSSAKELGSRNITVNAVAPGYIQTEMTEKLPEAVKEAYMSMLQIKRPGTPQDVARVVSFLAGDKAEYLTGLVINCDGGMLM
ncbi:MAG: 3-oxoacyl-[acyl-carrier-protein] reductase [candidate division Zixibacteria bacterium RBG_16_53_22]|nr:MAG: 3-oxoacyl-[acyl-carrier-protein] reductase [candidate division Zixibacteria bacterium RBG_16_53_22]